MLFSTNLLKQYISLNIDPKELMSTMTLHACEIEHVDVRTIPDLVVIGYVTETSKHPNADTLVICQLDCGSHGQYQICTAADNIGPNMYVPVALPGCHLPTIDLTIGSRQMRGEESNGMICAKVELGIDEDADAHGIWIMQEDFPELEKNHIGQSLTVLYPWLDNTILDVDNKTINNRPDLTGLLGMAIEMKAIFSANLTPTPLPGAGFILSERGSHPLDNPRDSDGHPSLTGEGTRMRYTNITHTLEEHHPHRTLEILAHAHTPNQQVQVQTAGCSIYGLLELHNISVRSTPFYDRLSLIDSGLSSKNNWVDFSNLFMTITGQPIHCFDADMITGDIVVRQATDGEQFTDLTGVTHTLATQDIVIADASGVIALAGVIGGLSTAISDSTKNIIIEIAHFDPVAVRRTSMRIGVRTDAVMRFEKTISPLLSLTTLSLILDLLKQYRTLLGDYTISGMSAVLSDEIRSRAKGGQYIPFDLGQCVRLIFGRNVSDSDAEITENSLTSLGFTVEKSGKLQGQWNVKIPRRRGSDDMNISQDLYEEVARIYGYNRIEPMTSHESVSYKPFTGLVHLQRTIEQILVQRHQVDQLQTYPRCDDDILAMLATSNKSQATEDGGLKLEAGHHSQHLVQLRNATAPELSYLRPSLIPNLLQAIAKNSKVYDTFTLCDSGQTWNKSEEFSTTLGKQSFETTKLGIVSYKKSSFDRKDDVLLQVKEMIDDLISGLGLVGTISYTPTSHSSYHPKKQGEIVFTVYDTTQNNQSFVLGTLAQLHPTVLESLKIEPTTQVVAAELYLETLESCLTAQGYSFQSDSNYQTIQDQILTRDICFVVDRTQGSGQIVDVVQSITGVHHVDVFDLYQGEHLPEDKKSIALTLIIVGDGSWKTDQINTVMDSAIAAVETIGGKLR